MKPGDGWRDFLFCRMREEGIIEENETSGRMNGYPNEWIKG